MKRYLLLSMALIVLCGSAGFPSIVHAASAKRQALVQSVLDRAQLALEKGQLTLPDYDNAYDHFTAALLLDPSNKAAQAGLQTVLQDYIRRIETALRSGRLDVARNLLTRATSSYPKQNTLLQLRQALEQAEAAAAAREQDELADEGIILLPPEELDARGDAIRERLRAIAEQIKSRDASAWIFARTDAEGRFIYGVMKAAVPEYRIRGDIKIHTRPRVQLEEPL